MNTKAYKLFKLDLTAQSPLCGMYNKRWNSRTFPAECLVNILLFNGENMVYTNNPMHFQNCQCGNYSFKYNAPQHLVNDQLSLHFHPDSIFFRADVANYGVVQEFDHGFKSEFCKIMTLDLMEFPEYYRENKEKCDAICKEVAQYYQLPVGVVDQEYEMPQYGQLDWAEPDPSRLDMPLSTIGCGGTVLQAVYDGIMSGEYKVIMNFLDKRTKTFQQRILSKSDAVRFIGASSTIFTTIAELFVNLPRSY